MKDKIVQRLVHQAPLSGLSWMIMLITSNIFGFMTLSALAEDSVHDLFIRQCYQLAASAAKKGNHPFGSLLVCEGKVVLTAENTVNTDNDFSRHAEMNLMVEASRRFSRNYLEQCTVYTSTIPCMGCAYAMMWRGISRIVYGVSPEKFATLMGQATPGITCGQVYQGFGRPLELVGPVLEDEGLDVYRLWPASGWSPKAAASRPGVPGGQPDSHGGHRELTGERND